MKGIVFTEFLAMVDQTWSPAMSEDIIETSALASGGAYTKVGKYDPAEMGALVRSLSRATNTSPAELKRAFGRHLLGRFHASFPSYFDSCRDVFAFVESLDRYVHVEVRKLYPDAELPSLDAVRLPDGGVRLTYKSPRCLGDLAEGLLEQAITHFGNRAICTRSDLDMEGPVQCVQFTLTPIATSTL